MCMRLVNTGECTPCFLNKYKCAVFRRPSWKPSTINVGIGKRERYGMRYGDFESAIRRRLKNRSEVLRSCRYNDPDGIRQKTRRTKQRGSKFARGTRSIARVNKRNSSNSFEVANTAVSGWTFEIHRVAECYELDKKKHRKRTGWLLRRLTRCGSVVNRSWPRSHFAQWTW